MRDRSEIAAILKLNGSGLSHSQISRDLGIPRCTVRDIIGRAEKYAPVTQPAEVTGLKSVKCEFESHREQYAFLLGFYLGDGYVCKQGRTYRLRLYSDSRDTHLIASLKENLQAIFPQNRIGVVKSPATNCVYVSLYSNSIGALFPSGIGAKHQYDLVLTDWQQRIVAQYPKPIVAGLFASDGCRLNIRYPRYEFSNAQPQIVDLLCRCLKMLNVAYVRRDRTREIKSRANREIVVVSGAERVAFLDTFVPLKRLPFVVPMPE